MLFISDAIAQTAPAASSGAAASSPFSAFLLPLLLIVVFYFFILRPQMKRQKEQKALLESLSKGDEVLTASGIIGKITDLGDQYMTLQVATVDGKAVEISMQRAAVQTQLPKGTMKSI